MQEQEREKANGGYTAGIAKQAADREKKRRRKRRMREALRRFGADFLSGMARGFGMAMGFSVLSAIVLIFLQRIAFANVPVIGAFLAEVMRIVRLQK